MAWCHLIFGDSFQEKHRWGDRPKHLLSVGRSSNTQEWVRVSFVTLASVDRLLSGIQLVYVMFELCSSQLKMFTFVVIMKSVSRHDRRLVKPPVPLSSPHSETWIKVSTQCKTSKPHSLTPRSPYLNSSTDLLCKVNFSKGSFSQQLSHLRFKKGMRKEMEKHAESITIPIETMRTTKYINDKLFKLLINERHSSNLSKVCQGLNKNPELIIR